MLRLLTFDIGVQLFKVRWLPWGRLDFSDPRYAPSRFRGIIECLEIQEPYLPDRVLRQFGYPQGIPDAPPPPLKVVRPSSTRKTYDVQYPADACQWGADPRPMIELVDAPRTTYPWECDPAYLGWWERMSHPYLDFRSPVQDPAAPVVDALLPPPLPAYLAAVAQNMVADMAVFLQTTPGLSQVVIRQISEWSLQLQGAAPFQPRPIPRGDQQESDDGDDAL